MIISHKHKFIFIKTRKTAGSTLEALLSPHLDPETDICTGSPRDGTPRLNSPTDNGHCSYREAMQYAGNPKDYFVFTVERNPWDKMVSAYWWHKETKPEWPWVNSFKEYMGCPSIPKDWSQYTSDRKNLTNRIFRYEDMGGMYQFLNDRYDFGITGDQYLNTRMKSGIRKSGHYSEMYDDYTKNAVAKLFQEEIYMLGYEYEQR